jgi:hypothetical protein
VARATARAAATIAGDDPPSTVTAASAIACSTPRRAVGRNQCRTDQG